MTRRTHVRRLTRDARLPPLATARITLGCRGAKDAGTGPVPVGTPVQLVAGAYRSCRLTPDHSARCWGYNHVGQLGDGTTTSRATPVVVP